MVGNSYKLPTQSVWFQFFMPYFDASQKIGRQRIIQPLVIEGYVLELNKSKNGKGGWN